MKQCIVALLLAPAAVAFAPQARLTQSARNSFAMRSTLDDGGAASASEGAADLDGDVIPDEIDDQDRKASPLAELDLNAVGLGMDSPFGMDLIDDFIDPEDEDLMPWDWEKKYPKPIVDNGPTKRSVMITARIDAIETHRRHPTDCGSSEVQIAAFTERIKFITAHVIENPKDHASRRGLLKLVSKRRRLMLYLHTKKPEVAENLAAELGIRFKFQNQIPSRAEKYREFTIRANQRRK